MIRALFVTLLVCIYILVLGLPVLIHALLTGKTEALYNVGRRGCRFATWLAGMNLEAESLEKIPSGQAVVFMANHQSNSDPPALLAILPRVAALAKKEFFRLPILGRGMRAVGFIPVDRKNRERAIEAVQEAVESLKGGRSFVVFPEGTRSRDGRLQPFKKGVFVMAIKAEAPIMPVSISGGSKIMPKGTFAVRPGPVRITFHDPIPTKGFALDERDVLMAAVRRAIVAGLTKEEWPLELSSGPGKPQPSLRKTSPA